MKIIHLPTSVGNHGYSLACAERRKGLNSTSITFESNILAMNSDLKITASNRYEMYFKKISFFLKERSNYDVYHFNFSSSLIDFPGKSINYLDLPFYKGARFATFNGSDLRRPLPKEFNKNSYFYDENYSSNFFEKEKRLNKLLNNIDFCFVLNPDLMRFLPRDKAIFLPYIKESALELLEVSKNKKHRIKEKFVIVHAPTNRLIKGSEFIIKEIERLKEKYPIEFLLVENMTHQEAKRIYQKADLLIDQMRIGWYGGVAIESMSLGIPVAVYINPKDLEYVPENMRSDIDKSFLSIDYDNFYEKISQLIESRELYEGICSAARAFVENHHHPDKLINTVIQKYRDFL